MMNDFRCFSQLGLPNKSFLVGGTCSCVSVHLLLCASVVGAVVVVVVVVGRE